MRMNSKGSAADITASACVLPRETGAAESEHPVSPGLQVTCPRTDTEMTAAEIVQVDTHVLHALMFR